MARLTLSLLILFCVNAFAGGSLMVEPTYDTQRGRTHYSLGLNIHEPILGKTLAYQSWTGLGQGLGDEVSFHTWYVTKHQVDVKLIEGLTVSPGVRLNYLDDEETGYKKRLFPEVYGKIAYTLW